MFDVEVLKEERAILIHHHFKQLVQRNPVRSLIYRSRAEILFEGGTSAERSGQEIFLSRHEFSHEKCSEILPEFFEP